MKLALSMYVLEATGSAAVFAGILSVAMVPTIILSPLGGILADRADKRKVMVALDALSGIFVLCAVLFLSAPISTQKALGVIGVLLVLLSILGAFETPTVQACIPSMLEGSQIIRGNAVVNQIASFSYLTAPVLGGVLYAAFGLKPVMYASVACFGITALFECFIRLDSQRIESEEGVFEIIRRESVFCFQSAMDCGMLLICFPSAQCRLPSVYFPFLRFLRFSSGRRAILSEKSWLIRRQLRYARSRWDRWSMAFYLTGLPMSFISSSFRQG